MDNILCLFIYFSGYNNSDFFVVFNYLVINLCVIHDNHFYYFIVFVKTMQTTEVMTIIDV